MKPHLDDPATTIAHGKLIRGKPWLNAIYRDYYQFFASRSQHLPAGKKLEIGSGAGFLKEIIPDVITSDVLPLPGNDVCCSALDLPFPDRSLAAIYMVNVLHHIPDAVRFFQEIDRCLVPGGIVACVEPAVTPWSRFIYSFLHHEPFNPRTTDWTLPPGGPLSMANSALPWIVFRRDRKRFEQLFPSLVIDEIQLCHPVTYLISGGLSHRQMLPMLFFPLVTFIENTVLRPFLPAIAMFMKVVIRKQ